MNTIDIYVIYCTDARMEFMKSQLESLCLPYAITYFKAETPETCPTWLAKCPVPDKLQCCFKSHIEALKAWVRTNSSATNLLILEDDVCLLKDNFSSKLQQVLQTYSEHPTIDYVSIGYLPGKVYEK